MRNIWSTIRRKPLPEVPTAGAGFTASYNPPHIATPTAIPVQSWGKTQLTAYYQNSMLAAKVIDLVVDDMLIRWRRFADDDDAMGEAEIEYHVQRRLTQAMKGARLYGGAILAIITKEAPLSTPLEIETIRPGDFRHLLYADRYAVEIGTKVSDILDPMFGLPGNYRLRLGDGRQFDIHPTRVLRFDGVPHPDGVGVWGDSVLRATKILIDQDTDLAAAAAYLVDRASLDVIKTKEFADVLSAEGGGGRDTATLAQLGAAVNSQKTAFRTIFMGADDDFERHTYSFAGIGDLFARFAQRLAAAAGVPQTRFWGASPMGMNATGDSDAQNYALQVAAWQASYLSNIIRPLDDVLARNAGLAETPTYDWLPLLDISDADRAAVAEVRMRTAAQGVEAGIIDEVEARQALISEDAFADLDPDAVPEVEEPTPIMMPPPAPGAPQGVPPNG